MFFVLVFAVLIPSIIHLVLALLPRGRVAFAVIVPVLAIGIAGAIAAGPFAGVRDPMVETIFALIGAGAGMAALAQGIRLVLPSPHVFGFYGLLVLVLPVVWFFVVIILLSNAWRN